MGGEHPSDPGAYGIEVQRSEVVLLSRATGDHSDVGRRRAQEVVTQVGVELGVGQAPGCLSRQVYVGREVGQSFSPAVSREPGVRLALGPEHVVGLRHGHAAAPHLA